MLANRLRRWHRHLRKWARRTGASCYRLYERDIPEHPLIIDWYESRAHVFAMERKRDETPEARDAWLAEAVAEIGHGLDLAPEAIFLKGRRRRREGEQYERVSDRRAEFVVGEQGLRFRVNLSDYHDTGLFLDHRNTRAMVRDVASGRRMLNLFAYTGSFSVYAAAGDAASTTTVDISNQYLEWARGNLELNGLAGESHRLVRADVLAWLPEVRRRGERFDLIVCDPPTFSNSKRMQGWFDVDSQHPELINACLGLLDPGGVLFFSTNSLGFRLREEALAPCTAGEISHLTVPDDFRNKRIHRCWRLEV